MTDRIERKARPKIVVSGAGISGIRTALDLAEIDCQVVLIDKAPTFGGILTQLDHQFPNNHCGMCRMLPMIERDSSSQFCLRRGLFHPNLTLLTSAEVRAVTGSPGNLTVSLTQHAAGVNPERCSGCGECEKLCSVSVPDAFNAGLTTRKAIYQPVPHQAAYHRVIDWEFCTRCQACLEACPRGAISLDDQSQVIELTEVGAVVVANGARLFDPGTVDLYGVGVLPNVITATAFERILSSSGPHPGRLVRPSDGQEIKRVAWVQCVGSRNLMIGADYCSRACCMFAVKEAVLAVQKIGPEATTAIFYMDMRTFGRDFQRYRDQAQEDFGVRFVRCRLHSVEPAHDGGDVRLTYLDSDAKLQQEIFDVVVLSTGQQPNQALPDYADQQGVIVLDSTRSLMDIGEAVISAGAASGKALARLNALGSLPAPADARWAWAGQESVFENKPRFQVILSDSPEARVAWDTVEAELEGFPDHLIVSRVGGLDSADGWTQLQQLVEQAASNRVVLVSWNAPDIRQHVRELARHTGLLPSLIEVVHLHHLADTRSAPAVAGGLIVREIEMAVNRLRSRAAREHAGCAVEPAALVVGGGPTGLTAALSLADCGVPAVVVEKRARLGGNLDRIHNPEVVQRIRDLVSRVADHPRVTVYTGSQVIWSTGIAGQFLSRLRLPAGDEKLVHHGVTILATGGTALDTTAYGLGSHERIMTQFELERRLHEKRFGGEALQSVAMLQCAGCREEPHNYCSRICCVKALQNALDLKDIHPAADIYVLYRDVMTYGESERLYTEARRRGILFIPFEIENKPVVALESGVPVVHGFDPILGKSFQLTPDLIGLSVGVTAHPTDDLCKIFGVTQTSDGFIQEADSKWRPLDTAKAGVFVAGLARAPARADEAMREGQAVAVRALRILTRQLLVPQRVAARVRHAVCSKCELCIDACPYRARYRDPELDRVMVDHAACQGCGTCAAVCPNSATVMGDFEDRGILDAIEAAL